MDEVWKAVHGRSVVAVGDAEWRAATIDQAREGTDLAVRVISVPPAASPWPPWNGLRGMLATLSDAIGLLGPSHAAALEAATEGRFSGDHLGVGEDLRGLLAATAFDGEVLIVMPDVHRLDLASAAALSYACAELDEPAVSVLLTQSPSTRGVHGIEVVRQDTEDPISEQTCGVGVEPAERLRVALHVGSTLDAADAAEDLTDWGAAARHWLDGGRPDLARRALRHVLVEDDDVIETRARVALATESGRRGSEAVLRAVEQLRDGTPVRAVRLRLLLLSGLLNRGAVDAARDAVEAAAADLDRAGRDRDRAAVSELVVLATAIVGLAQSVVGPETASDACARPLVRLTEGTADGDAIALLCTAAMVLTWQGDLDGGRRLLDGIIDTLDARRGLRLLSFPLATSAWLARRQAQLDRALADGTRAIGIARANGSVNDARFALVEVAHVEATQGRLESCRGHVAELVAPGAVPRGPVQIGAVSALAVAEMLAGHPDRAVELLEPVQEAFGASIGPAQVAWRHNLIEAYLLTDRRADAEAVLANLRQWVGTDDATRARGQLERSLGLLAAAGDYDAHFTAAARLLGGAPALQWRSNQSYLRRLLADGRRAEAESLAQELLVSAESVGAQGGVENLRRLLRSHGIAVGPTAPGVSELSVEHLRIALLIADGADDATIAERLRISRPVAELSRRRILSALGVRHAGELSSRLRSGGSLVPPETETVVSLFGTLGVEAEGGRSLPAPGNPSTVLAYVALRRGAHIEQVLDVLWPDATVDQARARLRNVLARLRASVGPIVVRRDRRLELAPGVGVDVHRFEALGRRALREPAAAGRALVDEALALWTGPPLAPWLYEDWAAPAIEGLDELHRQLVERRVALDG